MKRTLITAAALYLLYERQKATEVRLREHRAAQLALEAHLVRFGGEVNDWMDQLLKRLAGP